MPHSLSRTLPLLLALLFAGVMTMLDRHSSEAGPMCVIILIANLGWLLGNQWNQMDGYEKRIRQLENELGRRQEEMAETQHADGIRLPD